MKKCKQILNHIFVDGLSGMALGLFSTLLIGTIIAQLGTLIGGTLGGYLITISLYAKTITGAGIGIGVATKFKETPLVTVSAAVAGMIGAFPAAPESLTLGAPGEPLGAFVAAIVAISIGHLVSGKTGVDILVTPFASIMSGAIVGLAIGPGIASFMKWLGNIINVNVEQSPVIGGLIISVLMGMVLTLPISSAAIGISMGISGIAAGAATVGCCCQMIGFAVASYKENKMGGFIAQGLGTSMLQIPNIYKKPIIWLPSILSSALLGPVSSALLHMKSTPVGSGMGSCGLVGQIAAFGAMTEAGTSVPMALVLILLMHLLLPGILTLLIAKIMEKAKLLHPEDMKLNL